MTYIQMIAAYGGLSKAAKSLGILRQTAHAWSQRGRIPTAWQIRIAHQTGLKLDPEAQELARCARTNGKHHPKLTKRKK